MTEEIFYFESNRKCWVAGVLLSLFLFFIEVYRQNNAARGVKRLCEEFDAKININTLEFFVI